MRRRQKWSNEVSIQRDDEKIEAIASIETTNYLTWNIPLSIERVIAQGKLAKKKLGWTTTVEHALKCKIEGSVACQLCNTGETENREHILSDGTMYIELGSIALRNKERKEIITIKIEKQICNWRTSQREAQSWELSAWTDRGTKYQRLTHTSYVINYIAIVFDQQFEAIFHSFHIFV